MLIDKCILFGRNQNLLTIPYRIESSVAIDAFRAFASILESKSVEITNNNFASLSLLCTEFDFTDLES
jgi:hypothetical protein